MNTLIIPCAGRSSRFPNMKPKYLLTHPDGSLMIEKSLEKINIDIFDRVIITIVEPHNKKYEAELILKQAFANKKFEICVLDDFTSSASETVYKTIKAKNVSGSVVIKDSDNSVSFHFDKQIKNMIVGYNIAIHQDVRNVANKSFLIINEQNLIQDIIEKQVVSNIISLGIYCFENIDDFSNAYEYLKQEKILGEMYISHVISYLISKSKLIFQSLLSDFYEDWGTIEEWKVTQKKHRTYFIDVDGVILKNCGRYGSIRWENNAEVLKENVEAIRSLQNEGAQIVITTSRTEEFREGLTKILLENGIEPYAIIMGMNHSARVLINDFAPTNPYPTSISISLPRNFSIKEYL